MSTIDREVIAEINKSATTSFISFVKEKLTERGDKNIKIDNVRLTITLTGDYIVLADVSYIWFLHGWEKHVKHKDWVAVFKDGQWHSPHIW